MNFSLNSDRLRAVFFLKMMLRNILEHHFLIGTSLLSAHLGDSSFDRISSYVWKFFCQALVYFWFFCQRAFSDSQIASIGCLILTQIRPLIRKKTCFLWFENVFTNNHMNMQTALCTVIGQQAGNITYIQLTESTVNFFKFQVDIDVKDIDHIRSIIAVLRLN